MHVFDMAGAWGPLTSSMYHALIGPSTETMFEGMASEVLGDVRPERILDVGSGPGLHVRYLARRFPEAEVVGLDLSERMVSLARKGAVDTPNVRFDVGDAMALPEEDERYDLIFSLGSIKHWPDRVKGLREMYRVCEPGGEARVIEADRGARIGASHHIARHFKLIPSFLGGPYFHTFVAGQSLDTVEARETAEAAGWQDVRVVRDDGWPYWILSARK